MKSLWHKLSHRFCKASRSKSRRTVKPPKKQSNNESDADGLRTTPQIQGSGSERFRIRPPYPVALQRRDDDDSASHEQHAPPANHDSEHEESKNKWQSPTPTEHGHDGNTFKLPIFQHGKHESLEKTASATPEARHRDDNESASSGEHAPAQAQPEDNGNREKVADEASKVQPIDNEPSAPSETTTPSEPPFRFLDLHPELRNQIYTLAALSDAASGRPSSFRHLTQTNRQIRAEYRPIYLRTRPFHVDGTEVLACLEALYPGSTAHGKDKSDYTVHLLITTPVVTVRPAGIETWTSNILPAILGLREPWPGLTISVDDGTGLINQVLDIILYNAFLDPLPITEAFQSLKLVCLTAAHRTVVHCEIELKSEFAAYIRLTNNEAVVRDPMLPRWPVRDERVAPLVAGLCLGGAKCPPACWWDCREYGEDPLIVRWACVIPAEEGGFGRVDGLWRREK